jgi:uncharacterized protein (TIGR02246 family)
MRLALEGTNAAFTEALACADAAAAAAVYAENAKLLVPGMPMLEGRRAIERFWRTGIAKGIAGVKLQAVEFEDADNIAHEVGRYWLWIEPNGGEWRSERGKYVVLHRREPDGLWAWAVHIFNSDGDNRGSDSPRRPTSYATHNKKEES